MPTPHLDAVGAFRSPVENSCFMPGAKAPGGARNLAQGTPQEGSGRADPAMQDHPTFAATKKSADFARRKPDKATGGVEDCGGSRIPCCAWDLFWGRLQLMNHPMFQHKFRMQLVMLHLEDFHWAFHTSRARQRVLGLTCTCHRRPNEAAAFAFLADVRHDVSSLWSFGSL